MKGRAGELAWLSSIRHDNPAPALIFPGGRVLTYADIARRIDDFSPPLGQTKKLIAIEGRSSEHAIIAYLAALKGGHAVALLPPERPGLRQEFCDQFEPHFVYRESDGRWRLEVRDAAGTKLHPELSLLLATSGSEGKAKWVRLSAKNLSANARSIGDYLGIRPKDVAALSLPMHYSYGLSILNSHLAAGAAVGIICKSIIDDGWFDDVIAAGATNLSGVPYSYELLERIGFRSRQHDLRFMTCAGGRLAPDLVRLYAQHMRERGGAFFAMYGQTEATARIAYLPPDQAQDHPDCIGVAIPGGELHLVDAGGQRIEAAGEVGELVYSGPNVMMGYAAAAPDLERGRELSSLRTGDLAAQTPGGLYRIAGRSKRFSKIAGIRIDHAALEDALQRHGIEAAVAGDDSRLAVFHASALSLECILDLAMTATKLPARFFDVLPVVELPRLSSGKLDYRLLKSRADEAKPDRTSNLSVLAAFRRSFHPKPVAPSDTFRSLGGDSLLHVQLALDLEKTGGHLPVDWDQRPISQLERFHNDPGPRRIDTAILLRGLAIIMIVVHHATHWPIPAGVTLLFMLAGYALARFHAKDLFTGDILAFLKSVLAKLLPYYLILLGFAVAWQKIPWASVFLVGNLGFGHPDERTLLPFLYWFIEAYTQMMLAVALLFCVKPVRLHASRHPFEAGLVALGVSIALRIATPLVFDLARTGFNPTWLLFLLPLGWCVYFARTRQQKLLLAAAAIVTAVIVAYHGGNWVGSWIRYGLTAAGLLLLLAIPQVRFPRLLIWPTLTISAASFHIYLVHRIVPEVFENISMANSLLADAIGIAAGFGAYFLHRACRSWRLHWSGVKSVTAAGRP